MKPIGPDCIGPGGIGVGLRLLLRVGLVQVPEQRHRGHRRGQREDGSSRDVR